MKLLFMLNYWFIYRNAGESIETLEIITKYPYNIEECELYGEGSLDENYHIPGL